MKVIRGIKIGGLQQKIINLMLIFILALVCAYTAVSVYQQRNLTKTVQESSESQQGSIAAVSEETMKAILETSMTQTTALQAYIADDLFTDVRTDVLTLQAFAAQLFLHQDSSTFFLHGYYQVYCFFIRTASRTIPTMSPAHLTAERPPCR